MHSRFWCDSNIPVVVEEIEVDQKMKPRLRREGVVEESRHGPPDLESAHL